MGTNSQKKKQLTANSDFNEIFKKLYPQEHSCVVEEYKNKD